MLRDLTNASTFTFRLQSFQRPVHREMSLRASHTFACQTVPTRDQALEDNTKTMSNDGWTPMSDRPEDKPVESKPEAIEPKPERVLAPAFPSSKPNSTRVSLLTYAVISVIKARLKVTRTAFKQALNAFNHPVYIGGEWTDTSALTPKPVLKSTRYTSWCVPTYA